jgi:hypothetical protein
MPAIGATTYAELDAMLSKLGAKMTAPQVHALYLGAMSSTNLRLGPQRLLDRVLGEAVDLGEDPMEALQVILGYWNTLVAERQAGRVRLAPAALSRDPGKEELLAFARRRHAELAFYPRGIDAGGDDPIEFGAEGQRCLEGIAQGAAFLQAYVTLLEKPGAASAKDLRDARSQILAVIATIERLIGDLMDVSDAVRREALATFTAEAGRKTDDGARIARPVRIGRNGDCPCGSGRKWKRCCGAARKLQ